MIGLNFDMSFFPQGVLATDFNTNPIQKKVVEEIKTKFPKGDCITLDVSIKNAQGFLPAIFMEKAGGNYAVTMRQPKNGDSISYVNDYQKAYNDRKTYIDKMTDILPKYLQELEAEFKTNNCRDAFEKKRLEDMATILTKQATLQEKSVLDPNYKEQYFYIGIGAVVMLLGLYVISKK